MSACLVIAFIGYQLFITDLFNSRVQAEARQDLDVVLAERRDRLPPPQPISSTTTPQADEPEVDPQPAVELVVEGSAEEGATLGRMVIPDIEVDQVLFSGISRETLEKGPGHMTSTPVPGQPGNAVVSGHRTTHGRPFYDLDKLEEGDLIEVETAVGRHVFEIRQKLIVEPTDVWVTEPKDGAWLTLTTCHPLFSAAERLVVQAEMVAGPNLAYVAAATNAGRSSAEET